MSIKSNIINFSLVLLSYLLATSAFASEDDLCSPFKDAEIDKSIIVRMLEAAEDGHLYRIKPGSSKMGFCVNSPIGLVSGSFQNFKGGMALEGTNNQTVVSIDTSSLESEGLLVEKLLKSDDFFDTEKYPDIKFVSTDFEWLNKTQAVLKGQLSMRGVTKPIAFYVEISGAGGELSDSDALVIKATTTVQRSEFGMDTLSPIVSDRVNLCMSVEAQRYKS